MLKKIPSIISVIALSASLSFVYATDPSQANFHKMEQDYRALATVKLPSVTHEQYSDSKKVPPVV